VTSSFTRDHPVAHSRECKTHQVTMSGDHLPAILLALWAAEHGDCDNNEGDQK
jgi:hypothetical protein